MDKKKIFSLFLILGILIVFFLLLLFPNNKKEEVDENILYSRRFGNTILTFQNQEDVLGQNRVVGVEKSTDYGKKYTKVTKEPITVSQEARFLFRNEKVGYVISTGYIRREDGFKGFKVTLDGGKTFIDAKFSYDNENVDLITIEEFPYQDGNVLKMKCSVYDLAEDGTGYEEKTFEFESSDKGLTWALENAFNQKEKSTS